jgi:hypothetical protein
MVLISFFFFFQNEKYISICHFFVPLRVFWTYFVYLRKAMRILKIILIILEKLKVILGILENRIVDLNQS